MDFSLSESTTLIRDKTVRHFTGNECPVRAPRDREARFPFPRRRDQENRRTGLAGCMTTPGVGRRGPTPFSYVLMLSRSPRHRRRWPLRLSVTTPRAGAAAELWRGAQKKNI